MNLKNNIRKKTKNSYNKHLIKKEQNFYKNMISSKEAGGNLGFFNEGNLAKVILLVTVFLQIVSLATTFKGSQVYFGGIKLPLGISAPFLFAFGIQLIVFYVSNTLRANLKKWLIVVLIMATLCSTYFSYIGIYNYINSPISYLQDRYGQIYDSITDKYNIEREELRNTMKESIFNITNTLSLKHTEAIKRNEKNKEIQQKIDNIKVKSGNITAQTGGIKRPNINDYNGDTSRYYSDMAKYNATVAGMMNDAGKLDSDLKNQLYENEVKAILGGKTLDEFKSEIINDETTKIQIEKSINEAYILVEPSPKDISLVEKVGIIQIYCQDYIVSGKGKSEVFTNVLTNLNSIYSQVNNKENSNVFQKQLNNFIVMNEKDKVIMRDLSSIENEVYLDSYGKEMNDSSLSEDDGMVLYSKMQSEIKNGAYILNDIKGDNYIDLTSENYLIHNLYVLPIQNLITSNDGRQMAWFCLLFAALVDGLSLIFALTNGKNRTSLFAKRNFDVVGKSEEAMEEVLILSIIEKGKIYSDDELVDVIRVRLERFLNKFSLVTETIGEGYAMWAPIKELKEYEVFIATICQLNFATMIKREDIYSEEESGDETYVLIKNKFIFWINEKINSLTRNKAYMERVIELENNYDNGGEMA